ncbi:MAG TPA: serine/threonine-protein kinase [Kofleriaceae bacterium]|nr:serine/threonine-protein kinase [Kofleriaceae bacterium]
MAGDTTARVGGDWHGEPAEVRGRLGRYELRHVLGSGGMGVVFEAIDPELDRAIAVKILHAGSGGVDGDGAERLRREGQAMARLTHPNVIRVYDVGVAHGRMFVAMELIRGVTLADWIAQADRPAEEVIATYVQAGRGLAAAHAAGLVHRDFKPQNVLVGDDGRVLVTDFGLARSIDVGGPGPGGADQAAGDPTTAQPGVIEGTPAFMAPEQRSGGAVDARADQFSFSISLLRALAGAPSPDSWTASTIAQGAPFAPIVVEPGALGRVPARIRGALLRGLELAPERRFASMDELLAQLAPPPPPRPRSWPAWLAAGVVAAAVLGVLAWSAVDRGGAGAPADACAVAVDRVAPIWNDEARAAVQAAFRATGRSYADASFEAVARQLDARLAAWEHARRDNCEDTRLRREQSDAMMDLRAACLQRRLDDVTAFVAELRTADASTVDSAVTSAAAIGDVTACDDGVALARRAALPAEPAARAAIAQLERELSAARASVAAGRLKPGLALAEAAVARAREVGYVPLVAAALALAGEAHTLLEQARRRASGTRRPRSPPRPVATISCASSARRRWSGSSATSSSSTARRRRTPSAPRRCCSGWGRIAGGPRCWPATAPPPTGGRAATRPASSACSRPSTCTSSSRAAPTWPRPCTCAPSWRASCRTPTGASRPRRGHARSPRRRSAPAT